MPLWGSRGMDWQPWHGKSGGVGRRPYETLTFPNFCRRSGGHPMSAAESADRTPAPVTGGRDAAIIDISTRVGRQAAKGRRTVSTPHPGPAGGQHPQSPQKMLAEHFEVTFNHHGLSLTDEKTATAFTVTLEIMRGMLQGAQAQGILDVDEEQRTELDAMIKGMESAPRLLGG